MLTNWSSLIFPVILEGTTGREGRTERRWPRKRPRDATCGGSARRKPPPLRPKPGHGLLGRLPQESTGPLQVLGEHAGRGFSNEPGKDLSGEILLALLEGDHAEVQHCFELLGVE